MEQTKKVTFQPDLSFLDKKEKHPMATQAVPVVSHEEAKIRQFMPKVTLTEVEKLPSMGKAYPPGVKISHRPFVWGEVKKSSTSKLDTEGVYSYLLEGIECEGMDKLDLTVADVMFIGLLRKISTLGGTEIIARYPCDKCHKPGQIVFKTTDIEFDDMKAHSLPMKVEFDSIGKLEFWPLTIRKYFELLKLGEDKAKDEIALYAATAMGTKPWSQELFKDLYLKFYNATGEDGAIMAEADKYLYHGLKPLKKPCPNPVGSDPEKLERCGNMISVELDGGQALLLPFRRDQKPLKDRISFGVEDAPRHP